MRWSYSSLTAYEACPRKFYLTRVTGEVIEPQGGAAAYGSSVHEAIESYILHGTPMPLSMRRFKGVVDKVLSRATGTLLVEHKIALTDTLQLTDWDASDAWVRGIIDFGVVSGERALIVDWKTGKVRPDSDQLKLFAALMFSVYDNIETCHTGFVWLRHNEVTRQTFHRSDVDAIWRAFAPRVLRMQKSYEDGIWPARPGGLCRAWCPCKGCEYNGG